MYKGIAWPKKPLKNVNITEVKTEDIFIQFIDLYVIFLITGFS